MHACVRMGGKGSSEEWEGNSRVVVIEVGRHSTVLVFGAREDVAKAAAGCEW